MCDRESCEAAIATRKNTIVPHSTEPPYLHDKSRQAEAKSQSAQGEAAGDDGKAQAGAGDDEGFSRFPVAVDRSAGHQEAAASATGSVSSNAVP